MNLYKISFGYLIPISETVSFLRSNNNRWSLTKLTLDKIGIHKTKVSFDKISSRGKEGLIKLVFTKYGKN